jgi:Na+-driven multidrug efflux pump
MIGRALLLAGAIGAVLIALQLPILAFAFWLIDASPQVERYARDYFLIRIWATPAVLAGYAIIGWYSGLRGVLLHLFFPRVLRTIGKTCGQIVQMAAH